MAFFSISLATKLIISLYSIPLHLLLKCLITGSTKLLLFSGIIYQNLLELSQLFNLTLQPLVNVPPTNHSNFLRLNFALISKSTFSSSHTYLNLSRLDLPHGSLPKQRCKQCIARRGNIRLLRFPVLTATYKFNFTYFLI